MVLLPHLASSWSKSVCKEELRNELLGFLSGLPTHDRLVLFSHVPVESLITQEHNPLASAFFAFFMPCKPLLCGGFKHKTTQRS